MKSVRHILAVVLLLAALLSIVIPLPGPQAENLLTKAEAQGTTLTIYSGRSEELVGPIIEQFQEDTGIAVEVRYGSTTELALLILEEGENTEADVFFAQDAGSLGLLAKEGRLDKLPAYILDSVEPRFRSPDGLWVGITGRARVITYNTDEVDPEDLPQTLFDLTDPVWKGRIGWAPTNGSLHSHLTTIRLTEGDEALREFLQGLVANEAVAYPNNSAAVAGVEAGEVDVALVNHYYMYQHLRENPDAPLANYFFPGDDIGNLINVAGAGILATSDSKPLAQQFIAYLLSRSAQTYFVEETFEYPLLIGVEADPRLKPLDEIEMPDIDLTDLDDLEGTLAILDEVVNQ